MNVALVDLRGWDTMGELSVLILAATGVASLVFVTHRADTLSRSTAPLPPSAARTRRPLVETEEGVRPRGEASGTQRMAWLVGGQRVRPENRSILLEVIVRILFHSIIIVSLYVLFAGHNLPGGGFAGGLSRAWRWSCATSPAAATNWVPPRRPTPGACSASACRSRSRARSCRSSSVRRRSPAPSSRPTLPVLGHVEFVTSTLFDIGVYLVVIGLVLDVLRSLGAEVDRQAQELRDSAPTSSSTQSGVSA